jgi:hypothetical protein
MQAREMMSTFHLPERLYRIECHFWSENPQVEPTLEQSARVVASQAGNRDASSGNERSSLAVNLTNLERALPPV